MQFHILCERNNEICTNFKVKTPYLSYLNLIDGLWKTDLTL